MLTSFLIILHPHFLIYTCISTIHIPTYSLSNHSHTHLFFHLTIHSPTLPSFGQYHTFFLTLQALLTILTCNNVEVHGGTILQSVRCCYNIYLASRSSINQSTAKASLTQIISTLFQALENDKVKRHTYMYTCTLYQWLYWVCHTHTHTHT